MSAINALVALTLMFTSVSAASAWPLDAEAFSKTNNATTWVDETYASMTMRQRVAQLVVPRLDISDNAAGRAAMLKMVNAGVGGFLLGKGTIADYAGLIRYAQENAKIPLLVTLDGEWGLAMRVKDAPRFPYNISLGAIQDPQVLYDYGAELARECKAVGINVDFAPVLDVNSNPNNPVIGYRSFGEDAERVGLLGASMIKGMEAGGIMAVGKHFPGHGDTNTDSHKALPTIEHSRATLDEVDLVPFRKGIEAGMSGIMIGHLCVPALDSSGTPASLSSKITTELLKGELGFDGLVFTDALAMKGANSSENNCVRALRAGSDILLQPNSPIADIDAVVKAIESGKVSEKRLEEACKKVLYYKFMLGLSEKPDLPSVASVSSMVNSDEATDVNRRLAQAAITCVWNNDNVLPVRNLSENTVAVVSLGASAGNQFEATCRKYCKIDAYAAASGALTASQIEAIKKHSVVIVGVFSDNAACQASLAKLDNVKNCVPVFFINPFKLAKFASSIKHHSTLVTANDDTPFLREYAAQGIFGGIKIDGRMPVNVKGVCKVGAGVDVDKSRLSYTSPGAAGLKNTLTKKIDAIIKESIAAGAFPGCEVLIAKGGEVVLNKGYGTLSKAGDTIPVTTNTLYDIASMTKATATVSGIMRAYDEGLIDLDGHVADYISETDSLPVGRITIRELLTHQSGLPPVVNIYTLMMDPESYTGKLTSNRKAAPYTIKIEDGLYGNDEAHLREDLASSEPTDELDLDIGKDLYVGEPTYDAIMDKIYHSTLGPKTYKYSDLNFCLLMAIEEAVTGVAHDQWVDLEIFQPIGAYHTMYRPTDFDIPLDSIAPTEQDNYLRRQLVHGYVHDETAAFSGGVQGNAGLFSTAEDVAKLAQMWLYGGVYGGTQILKPETVELFTRTRATGANRGLGFDRLSRNMKSIPAKASSSTYGHTGFTGTCFWVDPENDIIIVFLSNRVNPTRNNSGFKNANTRPRIVQAVYDSL